MGGRQLTTDEYLPPPFSPSPYAEPLHNNRVTSNVLILPHNDYHWEEYWIGLGVIPLALVLILLLWMFALCVTACCNCETRRRRFHGFVAFIVFCSLSLCAWIPVYVANGLTDRDLQSVAQGLSQLSQKLDRVEAAAAKNMTALANLKLSSEIPVKNCSRIIDDALPEIDVDLEEFMNNLNLVIQNVIVVLNNEVVDTTHDLNSFVREFNSVFEAVIEARKTWTTIVATFMFIATVAFMSTTVCVFHDKDCARFSPNAADNRCLMNGLSKSACLTIFTVGLLVLTACWVMCALFQVLSTVSADLCMPNPDIVIQRLLAQWTDSTMVNPDGCFPDPNSTRAFYRQFRRLDVERLQSSPPDPESAAVLICFYQTCSGARLFAKALEVANQIGQVITVAMAEYEKGVDALVDLLNTTDLSKEEERLLTECVETFVSFTLQIGIIVVVVAEIVGVIQCRNLNQVYVALLRDGLCNGVITNTVLLWSSFLVALLFLMIAMLLHRIFRLNRPLSPLSTYSYGPKDSRFYQADPMVGLNFSGPAALSQPPRDIYAASSAPGQKLGPSEPQTIRTVAASTPEQTGNSNSSQVVLS